MCGLSLVVHVLHAHGVELVVYRPARQATAVNETERAGRAFKKKCQEFLH